MVEILLVVIIAILLFGGAAVLSAVSGVLGMVVAAIAFVTVCVWLGIDPLTMIVVLCLVSLATVAALRIREAIVIGRFERHLHDKGVMDARDLGDAIRRRKSLSDEELDTILKKRFAMLQLQGRIPEKSPVTLLYAEQLDRRARKAKTA